MIDLVIEQIDRLITEYGFDTVAWLLGEMLDITTASAETFMRLLGF